MPHHQETRLSTARDRSARFAGAVFAAGLAASLGGLANTAHADDLQMMRNIGDGYKSVAVITRYDIHPETRSFDLYATEPANPAPRSVEAEIAGQTVHEICTGGRIAHGWTVRIFLPGDPTPASSCRAGGGERQAEVHPHSHHHPHTPTAAAAAAH